MSKLGAIFPEMLKAGSDPIPLPLAAFGDWAHAGAHKVEVTDYSRAWYAQDQPTSTDPRIGFNSLHSRL